MMGMLATAWDFLKDNAEVIGVVGTLLGALVAVYRMFFATAMRWRRKRPLDEIISAEMNVSPIHSLAMLKKVYAFDEKMYKFDLEEAGARQTIEIENISFSTFESWWQAFPTGFLIASSKGEPVAVIGIFPVTAEWAEMFLAREVDEYDLSAEVITKASGKIYYVSGISTTIREKGLSKHLPRFILPAIFEWIRVHIEKYGHEEIRLVSEGSSQQGQDLLERMNFTLEAPSTSPEQRPRYSKRTTTKRVTMFLMDNPWIKLCPALQAKAKSTFS